MLNFEETIIARATPPGGAIRGIVRLSGPESLQALHGIFRPEFPCSEWLGESEPAVRIGRIFPWNDESSAPAKIFFWPEGRGYTGQQSVEIHTVGSPPILDALVLTLCRTGRVRPADPGEFTLRAFLSGRLDLSQAEAVLGVIDAEDPKTLETALHQLAGGVASPLRNVRETLFETLARLEAGLDFADEDIEFISATEIRRTLGEALRDIDRLSEKLDRRGISDEKPVVVLTGPPNAGKSTLFNALLKKRQALVSSVPGTTRDYLEAEARFGNRTCTLVDTAGTTDDLPEPDDDIDRESRRFAFRQRDRAAIVLNCRPVNAAFDSTDGKNDARTIFVRTKSDVVPSDSHAPEKTASAIAVSGLTGFGLETLCDAIEKRLDMMEDTHRGGGEMLPSTLLRCREALATARESLHRALDGLSSREVVFDDALLAGEIRIAVNALGLIDGTVHTEDLLDGIFSRFCIGK